VEKQVRHVISKPFNNKRPIKPPPSKLNLEAEIVDNRPLARQEHANILTEKLEPRLDSGSET
jgi:hypothetical protein